MDAVKTIGLTKKYKDITAVDGIDLTVRKGELFSLLGVNGAGKTTTVKMLCCLTEPTAGEAYVGGFSVKSQSSEVRKIIGVSPQETAVAPKLTVKENLGLMCGVHGFSKEESLRAIEELVEKFRLGEILGKSTGKLSGGWQRRLSIAMALIGKPEILFLDEPTLGLDVIARAELWEVIREMKGSVTVILTTHYMEEAESLSDRVAIMKGGKILASGTPDEIKTATGQDRLEQAFISVIKEAEK